MSTLVVTGVLSVLAAGILVMIALGSIFMLVHNWYKHGTNERLTKLEEGQDKINERIDKLEEGQSKINERMDKLEEGQSRLQDYVETKMHELHDLLSKTLNTVGELSKQLPKKEDNKP